MAIKLRGSASKATPKRSTSKPASTTKRTRNAAKATPKAKPAATSNGDGRRGRPRIIDQMDPELLKAWRKPLEQAGERRREAEEEHKQAVADMAELTAEARDDGMPIAAISDLTGVSRQWLEKISNQARNGEAPKKPGRPPKGAESPAQRTRGTAKTGTSKPRARIKRR